MGEVFSEFSFEGEHPDLDIVFEGAAFQVRRGDPGWLEVYEEALAIHVEKADGYGTEGDRLANYVETSEVVGQPDEYTCWLRIHEKCVRALNLIRAGRADEVKEGPDVAGIAFAAEALRRRRL